MTYLFRVDFFSFFKLRLESVLGSSLYHYFLLKMSKRLFHVPSHTVTSNCGTLTEKASEFLDHHLETIMKPQESYVKKINDFLKKI